MYMAEHIFFSFKVLEFAPPTHQVDIAIAKLSSER